MTLSQDQIDNFSYAAPDDPALKKMLIRAVEAMTEPDDLRAALDAAPEARRQWDAFPPSTRKAILDWIRQAKQAETRARRVTQTVDEASVGRRANQWRQPGGTPR